MPLLVFFEYMAWLYGDGVREYLGAWQNIHWFLWRVFSVSLLIRTFFMPFRRTSEPYGRGFDPSAIASTFLINFVTRFVGMLVRGVLLVVAAIFQAIIFVLGVVFFIWFILTPVVVPVSMLIGILVILI